MAKSKAKKKTPAPPQNEDDIADAVDPDLESEDNLDEPDLEEEIRKAEAEEKAGQGNAAADEEEPADEEGAGEEEGDAEPDEIQALKKQIKEANDKNAAKDRELEELRQKNKGSNEDRFAAVEREIAAHEKAIESTIIAKNAEIEKLERELVELQTDGDFVAAAKKQREINKLDFQLTQAENAKVRLEASKEQLKTARETAAVENEAMTEEDYITAGYPAAARQWIKDHSEFQVDKKGAPLNRFTRIALAAHQEAIDVEEIKEGSPEYFQFINNKLISKGELEAGNAESEDENDADDEEEEEQQAPPVKKKKPAASTAAPGAGRSPSGGGKKKGRLTPEEADAAKTCGMTHEEYWEYMYGDKA